MIIISIVFFTVLLSIIMFSSYDVKYSVKDKAGVNTISHVTVLKDGIRENVSLDKEIEVDGPFDILIDITEYQNTDNISIFTWFIYACADVYVDDKLIFFLDKRDDAISKSGAYAAVIFDLPNRINSPYVRMHIEPTIESLGAYKIEKMSIGRKSDIIMEMIKSEYITIIISTILIINFIFSIVINLKMKEFMKFDHYALLNVSIVGAILSIYFLTQTRTMVYFFGSFREGIYFLEYIMLNIVLIPSAQYIKHKVDVKFSKTFNIIITLIVLNVIVESILTLAKIIEFKEMIYITHMYIIITTLTVFVAIIFTDSRKFPSKKSLFLPVVAIIVTAIIPIIYYVFYKGNIFKNIGLVTVVALIIIEIHELYKKYFDYKKEKMENKIYRKLAITDSLTGLKNRQAHEDFIKMVEKEKMSGWILSIDINNLKYINDKFGHMMGDRLIMSFADILVDIESKDEKNSIHSFRIGGDEFFIFIEADYEYDILALINCFKMRYNTCDSFEEDFCPSFSAGYYYYDFEGDKTVMDIYNIADRQMYEDKAKYKREFRQRMT